MTQRCVRLVPMRIESRRTMLPSKRVKRFIKLTCAFTALFVLLRYLGNADLWSNDPDDPRTVSAVLANLEQAKHLERIVENKYQFTAVILHWKRTSGVRIAIRNYLKSRLFKEIIVWNNNALAHLTESDLINGSNASIPIRIINSAINVQDRGKYLACTLAQTLACFYSDDDWDASPYMNSLIASFRADPNLLHSATNAVTHYNNMLWTFMDSSIDLHTGHSWIGCGSVFLRDHARRHLDLLSARLIHQPGKQRCSYWTINRCPFHSFRAAGSSRRVFLPVAQRHCSSDYRFSSSIATPRCKYERRVLSKEELQPGALPKLAPGYSSTRTVASFERIRRPCRFPTSSRSSNALLGQGHQSQG